MSQTFSRLRILTSTDIVAAVNEKHPAFAPFMAILLDSLYQMMFFDMMVPDDTKLPDMMKAIDGIEDRSDYLLILNQAKALMGAAAHDAYLEACVTGLIDLDGES